MGSDAGGNRRAGSTVSRASIPAGAGVGGCGKWERRPFTSGRLIAVEEEEDEGHKYHFQKKDNWKR